MKTKLLRLLRKRFYWYNEDGNYWYFYDKKTNNIEYAHVIGMKPNDALLLLMLEKIGIGNKFVLLVDRKLKRRWKKEALERRQYFSKFFK